MPPNLFQGAFEMSAASTVSNEAPVTWDEFAASAQWLALTPRQKVWTVAYLASNDETFATTMAYDRKNAESMRIQRYEVRRHPVVRSAIGLFRGNERETLLDDVRRTAQKAEPGSVAQVRALSLYARLAGYVTSEAVETEKPAEKRAEKPVSPKFKVGDVATLDGKTYRITALNPDGTVSEADPL
jgi:hypothetical protein